MPLNAMVRPFMPSAGPVSLPGVWGRLQFAPARVALMRSQSGVLNLMPNGVQVMVCHAVNENY